MHSTHRIGSMAALAAAMAEAASPLVYPCNAMLDNNAWRDGVEPELCALVPGHQSVKVTIRDAGQLVRVVGNLEQLNALALWAEGVGLHLVLDVPVAAPAAEVAPVAQTWSDSAPAAPDSAPAPPPEPALAPVPAPQQNAKPGKRDSK